MLNINYIIVLLKQKRSYTCLLLTKSLIFVNNSKFIKLWH